MIPLDALCFGVFGNNIGFLANKRSVHWMSRGEMVDRMLQRVMC